jgi:phosphoenolpyruvate carboxylase
LAHKSTAPLTNSSSFTKNLHQPPSTLYKKLKAKELVTATNKSHSNIIIIIIIITAHPTDILPNI